MSVVEADHKHILKAIHLLQQGKIVAFPTETVYGLGADVRDEFAIRRVYEIKKRPTNHPVIVHIDTLNKIKDIAVDVPKVFWPLAEAFWPGPLTVILKKSANISDLITAGQSTVGIRMPKHPLAHKIIEPFPYGIIGPSANMFTQISPTKVEHVIKGLGKAVDGIVDGGPCEVGIESTIVAFSGNSIQILRQGVITQEMIQAIVPEYSVIINHKPDVKTPGQHLRHYAPKTKMILCHSEELKNKWEYLRHYKQSISGFGFHDIEAENWVKMPKDPQVFANKLYDVLHQLDEGGYQVILCEKPPLKPNWLGIYDRLKRSCHSLSIEEV